VLRADAHRDRARLLMSSRPEEERLVERVELLPGTVQEPNDDVDAMLLPVGVASHEAPLGLNGIRSLCAGRLQSDADDPGVEGAGLVLEGR
jgi:hypothetical protein